MRRHAIVQAQHGGDGPHHEGQRREEGDVPLALERVVPAVTIERDIAVPPGIETRRQVRERVFRWSKARVRIDPECDDGEEPDDQDGRACRQERAAGNGKIRVALDPATSEREMLEGARGWSQQVADDQDRRGRVQEWQRGTERDDKAEHQVASAAEERDPQRDCRKRERGDVGQPERQRQSAIVWGDCLCRHSDP